MQSLAFQQLNFQNQKPDFKSILFSLKETKALSSNISAFCHRHFILNKKQYPRSFTIFVDACD